MKDWIHPIQQDTPFFTSNKNFTKIAVDRVQASDENMHNVLLLATGTWMISVYWCLLRDFLHSRENNNTLDIKSPSLITGFCLVFFLFKGRQENIFWPLKFCCAFKSPIETPLPLALKLNVALCCTSYWFANVSTTHVETFINFSHSFVSMGSFRRKCRAAESYSFRV